MIDLVYKVAENPLAVVGFIAILLFWQNREHQMQMANRLATLEETLVTLIHNNTLAMESQANALREVARELKDRPCQIHNEGVK